jgi:hypothetical protein
MISMNWQKLFLDFSLLAKQRRGNPLYSLPPSLVLLLKLAVLLVYIPVNIIMMSTDCVQGGSCHIR